MEQEKKRVFTKEDVGKRGFASESEFISLISSLKIGTEEKQMAFIKWQENMGTKKDLLELFPGVTLQDKDISNHGKAQEEADREEIIRIMRQDMMNELSYQMSIGITFMLLKKKGLLKRKDLIFIENLKTSMGGYISDSLIPGLEMSMRTTIREEKILANTDEINRIMVKVNQSLTTQKDGMFQRTLALAKHILGDGETNDS